MNTWEITVSRYRTQYPYVKSTCDYGCRWRMYSEYIPDERVRALVSNIVASFCSTPGVAQVGLPLGNLTSQLLVNIYMNEFDQFVKHKLKAKHYIRYADDFVTLSEDRNYLLKTLPCMVVFLRDKLKLEMHPN